MRYLNMIGNKLFSYVLTWILGQRVKDTLCGTKGLRGRIPRIRDGRRSSGSSIPSATSICCSARHACGLKIVDFRSGTARGRTARRTSSASGTALLLRYVIPCGGSSP